MRTGSHINAYFKGKQKQEYGWFALSGTNPLLSVSAERAARQILNATQKRQTEVIVGWQAKMMAPMHGGAPGCTQEALALANRPPPQPHWTRDKTIGTDRASA